MGTRKARMTETPRLRIMCAAEGTRLPGGEINKTPQSRCWLLLDQQTRSPCAQWPKRRRSRPPRFIFTFQTGTCCCWRCWRNCSVSKSRSATTRRKLRPRQAAALGGAALVQVVATVEFGLKHPWALQSSCLKGQRVVPRLSDPRVANFGRPLLARSIELIREIPTRSGAERVSEDPQRLALLLWSGLHGVISLRINKPTFEWPQATELAEQITRAIIQPSEPARTRRTHRNNARQL